MIAFRFAAGGELRLHLDRGRDEFEASSDCPEPSFVDVAPKAGALVLFKSDSIPHEVTRISRAENDAPRYLI